LYALNAVNDSTKWRAPVGVPSATLDDFYNWSSPTVAGGVVYVGISSHCDQPLVPGGVRAFDQATGGVIATYHSTRPGQVGASVWSSVLVTRDGRIFATTGNGPAGSDQSAIVRLVLNRTAHTLTRADLWSVPKAEQVFDSDFGSSPTEFTAVVGGVTTTMVGSCNKNGIFYALRAGNLAAGPVWSQRLGQPQSPTGGQCDAAAVWDGRRLFAASNNTNINGASFGGSLRRIDPATGAVIWSRGLPGPVIGSPTLNAGGVLAVGVFARVAGPFLVGASGGALLWTAPNPNGKTFAQSPFTASGLYLSTTQNTGITAYRSR
jgi:outer membrane protein assembly factor BamB